VLSIALETGRCAFFSISRITTRDAPPFSFSTRPTLSSFPFAHLFFIFLFFSIHLSQEVKGQLQDEESDSQD
jgi:hypothetical protein